MYMYTTADYQQRLVGAEIMMAENGGQAAISWQAATR